LKLRIEKAIYGGAGLARTEGKTVFVPFALPGETVEARIVEDRGGFAKAELDEVVEASEQRVKAPCPYFGTCGGCHYQHAEYAAQVEMKRAILRETLERARIREIPEIRAVTGQPFGYRNRIRLHVEANPFQLCYKRRKSQTNLSVESCPIAAPSLQQALAVLNRDGQGLGLGAWTKEIELFVSGDERAMLLSLWTERPDREAEKLLAGVWPNLQESLPAVVGAGVFAASRKHEVGRILAHAGQTWLEYPCGKHRYRVSLAAFFQANQFLVDALVRLATEGASGTRAWDLYAGVGLFSLSLAETFDEVTAVESGGAAVRDLRENLRGTKHRVVAAETAVFLRRAVDQRVPAPDLVVVDPPRAGLGREVTTLLGKIAPAHITYVSCDPATLGRDVAALLESGYRLTDVHLVDLFPQTYHMESVTRLARD